MKFSTLLVFLGCVSVTVLGSDVYDDGSDTQSVITTQQCIIGGDLNTKCMGSMFRFSANFRNIARGCVESPEITLNDLLWKIKFCYQKNKLIAHLDASSNSQSSDWTSDAKATIKIFPYGDHDRIIVKQLPSHRYSASSKKSNGVVLMAWSDYTNYCMSNDYDSDFEVEITTNPVKAKSPLGMNQISTKLQILLDNVSNLSLHNSSMVILQGIKWRVQIRNRGENLSVNLIAEDDFLMGTLYKAEATFKLLTFDINSRPLTKSFTHNYCWGSTEHGIDDFLPWSTFTNTESKYVMQDKARILVQIKVAEPQMTMWDNGIDLFEADESTKCSNCNRDFIEGIIFANCGHLWCKQCYDQTAGTTCRSTH